jgi:hypothetical protein
MALTANHHNTFLPEPARAVLPYFLLSLLVFIAYANIFDNVFLFDDDLLIQLNTYLRDWHHIGDIIRGSTTSGAYISGGFYRPVQILLYLIAYQLGNGSTFPFHLLNLCLHITNVCLVYRLATNLGFQTTGRFIATLIWGLHPLHTEAVTYISATADPLFSFFCLLAIVILVPEITQKKIFQIIPLFLLGLLSKETAVMFPLMVMSCLFLIRPKRLDFRTYLCTWPLWVITIVFSLWRVNADFLDGPKTFSHLYTLHAYANLKLYADHPLCRLYTFFATLPIYLKLFIWPTGLHMERSFSIYDIPWAAPVITGFSMTILSATQIIQNFRKTGHGHPLSWGLLWFFTVHSPDSGLLVPMNALFLEHWMYLPSVGLILGTSETISGLVQGKAKFLSYGCALCGLCFAGMLGIMTYNQNKIWRDPPSFYNNIFLYGEQSARARNNLALYYADHNDFPNSLEQFRQAVAISDTYAETRHNIALIYMRMPDQMAHVQDAINNLNRAIELDPTFYRSYQTLGDIYELILHDPDKASYYHQRAAELKKLRE